VKQFACECDVGTGNSWIDFTWTYRTMRRAGPNQSIWQMVNHKIVLGFIIEDVPYP